jgi:hypothetical protein
MLGTQAGSFVVGNTYSLAMASNSSPGNVTAPYCYVSTS